MSIQPQPGIDEYLRKRLMPVEGAIPHLARTDMYGNSIPAGSVGGDLFEYINFQQRYNIDARIARALRLSKEYLEPVSEARFRETQLISLCIGLHRIRPRTACKRTSTEGRRAQNSSWSQRICANSTPPQASSWWMLRGMG